MHLWKNSLMGRLVGYFLLLSLLIISIVGYTAYVQARAALEESAFERLRVASSVKVDEIDRWINEQCSFVEFLAMSPTLRMHIADLARQGADTEALAYSRLHSYMQSALVQQPNLQEIMLLRDTDGQVLLSTSSESEYSYREWASYFQNGLRGLSVQNVYASPTDNGRPAITISAPVVDEQGQRQAVLAVHLNLDRLDSIILDRVGLGQTGEIYLVDSRNAFVSGERFGSEQFPRGVHTIGINRALGGEDGAGLYYNYRGVPVMGVYSWMDDHDLALLTEIEQAEAFAPAQQVALTILALGIVAAVVLAVGVYMLAGQIAQPIVALSYAATQVAAGKLDRTVPVMTDDEIGMLAQSFNLMTGRLRILYSELQRSEEYFRSLIEQASDIITIVDSEGRILYDSPSTCGVLGYESARFQGRQISDFVHPDDQRALLKAIRRGVDQPQRVLAIEGRFRHADGSWRVLEGRGKYLRDPLPEAGVVLNLRDISKRKHAELELRESERRLQRVVSSASIILFAINRSGIFTFSEGRSLEALQARPGGAVGHSIYEIYGDVPEIVAAVEQCLQGEEVETQVEVRGVWLDLRYSPYFGENGEVVGMIGVAMDMTERKHAEEERIRLQEETLRARREFIATVSHELRTPLTPIRGYVDLLMMGTCGPLTELQHESLEVIKDNTLRMRSLVDDLLDMGHIESGRIALNREPMDMRDIIRREISSFQTELDRKKMTLVLDLADDLPVIDADTKRVGQVLANLISNAIKYTFENGTITVRVFSGMPAQADDNRYIEVHVADTGVGLTSEQQAKLFTPFYRADNPLQTEAGGTGLGLNIARSFVELHGGHMWTESTLNEGSTFAFVLPVKAEADTQDDDSRPEPFSVVPALKEDEPANARAHGS